MNKVQMKKSLGLRLSYGWTALLLFSLTLLWAFSSFSQEKRRELRALYIGKKDGESLRARRGTAAVDANSGEKLASLEDHLPPELASGRFTVSKTAELLKENQKEPVSGPDVVLQPPKIDGALDDPVWQLAPVADGFTQRDPVEGAPATEPTEVRVLYDDENLYIGFRCLDRQPDKIVARQMRNDADLSNDDHVRILIDTYLDRRNAFAFQTNPLGARWDAQITDEGRNENIDWNIVWEVKARKTDEGWEAEFRIPLNQLRYPERVSRWGINFARVIRRKREDTYWSPIKRDYGFGNRAFYRISKAGDLFGLERLTRRPRLEIRPYSLSGLQKDATRGAVKSTSVLDFGLDIKYGLGSNLIADITVNTDFAQVEADQERVNLTRFSLFFPEKRDFFLEGAGIFRVGAASRPGRRSPNEQLFYSRRIGLHNGKEVPILLGTKVTGKVGDMEVGLLDVVTDRFVDQNDQEIPRMNYGVLRLRKLILSRSSVGFMILSRDPFQGDRYNRTFVVDGNFAFGPSTQINAWLAKTHSPGIRTRDWAGNFNFVYRSDRWMLRANYTEIQENFKAEMGFIRRDDIRRTGFELGRGIRPSWAWLRRIYNGASLTYLTNGRGILETREIGWRTWTQFESGHVLFSNPRRMYEFLDKDWQIYPGIVIPAGVYEFWTWNFFFRSDQSRALSIRLGGDLGEFYSGTRYGGNFNFTFRPSPHIAWDLSFNSNIVSLPAGDFTTNVLSTRFTYTFSRDMFAKAYIQWNDSSDLLSLNFLYNYYYLPGSNIYLVYNHRWNITGKSLETMDRALLLKVTYWLNW